MGFILLLILVGIIGNALFWGLLIYLGVKIFRRANPQQLSQVAGMLSQYRPAGGQAGHTPVGDTMRSWAAQNGIDPNF